MLELLISNSTREQLAQLRKHTPQAVLLAGPKGVGLLTIAKAIAGKNIAGIVKPEDKEDEVDEINGKIKVSMIRSLYSRSSSKSQTMRVFVIDNADRMNKEAQNAFLKLLEEPNEHVTFILTSHTPDKLLPTIRSRVQKHNIPMLNVQETAELISRLFPGDRTKQAQVAFVAGGLPAEIHRLANDEVEFDKKVKWMSDARTLVTGSPYEKLIAAAKYAKDRSGSIELIDACILITRRAPHSQATTQKLSLFLDIREKLERNYHVRLQLMRTVV